jgi:hypothetical protein
MFKVTPLLFLLLTTAITWFLINKQRNTSFRSLNAQQLYQKIIEERDFAIQKAEKAGDYRCCIEPPCTMCYMKANQWNNFTAGTCACDDLIAQGKEPCPQCKGGLCETSTDGSCKINGKQDEISN